MNIKTLKKNIIPIVVLMPMTLICMLSSCKKEEDKCKDVICPDHAYCDIYTGKCKCEFGYEGINCDTLMRTKFIGGFQGHNNGTGSINDYTIKISGKPKNDITKISITNIANSYDYVIGTITGSTNFTVERQIINFLDDISGKGTIKGDSLTLEYSFHNLFGGVMHTCTFIGTKQ